MLDIDTSIHMIGIVPWVHSSWRLYVCWFQHKFVAICRSIFSCSNYGFHITVWTFICRSIYLSHLHKDLQLLRNAVEGNFQALFSLQFLPSIFSSDQPCSTLALSPPNPYQQLELQLFFHCILSAWSSMEICSLNTSKQSSLHQSL